MNPTDAKRIRSIADRVERINEEIAALNADKREIFAEARDEGHDVKALKAAIKIRHQKTADSAGFQEHEHLVELYLNALDSPEETGHARTPAPCTRDPSDQQRTPAPAHKEAAGGATPSPSTSAQPSADSPAEEEASTSVGQPVSGNADEDVRPTTSETNDDGLDIPTFMKRDANNRAPWMEGAD